jgi:hypothetical protein
MHPMREGEWEREREWKAIVTSTTKGKTYKNPSNNRAKQGHYGSIAFTTMSNHHQKANKSCRHHNQLKNCTSVI